MTPLLALLCRLKTSMSNKAATTQQLSEYLKHAKGRTRTAIRNGQVWEESLKRLRQKATSTNVTGTENPLARRGQEGVLSSQERAEGTKSCVPSEEPFLREAPCLSLLRIAEQGGAKRTVRPTLFFFFLAEKGTQSPAGPHCQLQVRGHECSWYSIYEASIQRKY